MVKAPVRYRSARGVGTGGRTLLQDPVWTRGVLLNALVYRGGGKKLLSIAER